MSAYDMAQSLSFLHWRRSKSMTRMPLPLPFNSLAALLCLIMMIACTLTTASSVDPSPSGVVGTEVDDLDSMFTMNLGPELKETAHQESESESSLSSSSSSSSSCPPNTHRVGKECIANTGCTAQTCGGYGTCSEVDGYVRCHCEPGFVTMGFDGLHCNACDSPQAVFPNCHIKDLVDEKRRDTISPNCPAQVLPHTLNQAGYLPPESDEGVSPIGGDLLTSYQLEQHSIHFIDWYWINVEAGSGEITFHIAHDSLFRMHISKMTQVAQPSGSTEDLTHQHLDTALGAHDSRLSVVPSLYSSTSFLQSGTTILSRNEVSIFRRLAPGDYKLLFEYDSRLSPNFLLESCPKFLLELQIEPDERIKSRLGVAHPHAAAHPNPHIPDPPCPAESRLPVVEDVDPVTKTLLITSHGYKFAPSFHVGHSGDHAHESWYTVNAKDPLREAPLPQGRLVWSQTISIPDLVGFQALFYAKIQYQFGVGALRLSLSTMEPSFTFTEQMFGDSYLDSNELRLPLAPEIYHLNVFEPLPQMSELSGQCIFWNIVFEVEFMPIPSVHLGLNSEAANAQLREMEQVAWKHEELCPYQPLPTSLNTIGYAGLHGNNLHLQGQFRVDFQSSFAHHHDLYFSTAFIHDSPFSKTGSAETNHAFLSQASLFRFYLPAHETPLKFHVELIRLSYIGSPPVLHEETIKGIDTSVWDHMVHELDAGEYLLRFSLSHLAFKPNEELCSGFTMEMSVAPLSRVRVADDCVTREPTVPGCPAIPYAFSGGFGSAPFAAEFSRPEYEAGSADIIEFPLEIRYRDTIVDMEVVSDFARAPVSLILLTDVHGDQQEPMVDVSLTSEKLRTHSENSKVLNQEFHIHPDDKSKMTGHAIVGRQLKKNSNSLRTILKPGHYSIHIRLLAPAPFNTLQTGKEGSTDMKEAHHICVPYQFKLTMESAISLSMQQQACLEHGSMFILPPLLNTLEFIPTEHPLSDTRVHFSRNFLLPHAHEKQDGAQPLHDHSDESYDQSFFWLESLSLVHIVLDQMDRNLRVMLIRHPSCPHNPTAGMPPMHHVNGEPYAGVPPAGAELARMFHNSQHKGAFVEIESSINAGPLGIHPDHAAEGDDVSHDAGFSPSLPHQRKAPSHPGSAARPTVRPMGETDQDGNSKSGEAPAAYPPHVEDLNEHYCENITLFESTEPVITMHRYLMSGLYSIVVEETEASREEANRRTKYESCPYYHLQFSIAPIFDMEKLSSNTFCNVKNLEGESGGIHSSAGTALPPTAGMDSWPPDMPRKITQPYFFDSVLANRSLHFQQKLNELRAETFTFHVDEFFHFYAEIRYDFYVSYITLDLMTMNSHSLVNFPGRDVENGHLIVNTFLPRGDYILTIAEGKKKMDQTPQEILDHADAVNAASDGSGTRYTLHHEPSRDHPGFQCVEFSFKIEVVPVSAFARGLSLTASEHATASDHHSFKSRLVSDALHPSSHEFVASNLAAQTMLHFAATHIPNYPYLPRTLCSINYMRDVVDADLSVELHGIYSLNAVFMNEDPNQPSTENNAHLANKITFTLSSASVLRLFATPYANRMDPEAARAFVLSTSLTHELDANAAHTDEASATSSHTSAAMEMQTSEPTHGAHDHFSWMYGVLYPGTYTLQIQPLLLPSHRAIYSSGLFGRMHWFESVIQLAITPIREDMESLSPHACAQHTALPTCSHAAKSSPDSIDHATADLHPSEHLEFHQNGEKESFHHVAQQVPVCPNLKGQRVSTTTLTLDRRSELSAEILTDFLSNDAILSVQRMHEASTSAHRAQGWGVDRWIAHRSLTGRGSDISLILPKGTYVVSVQSLGFLHRMPFIFGCGQALHFELHVEPVVEGSANLKHGLVQAKPSVHVPQLPPAHPAVQDHVIDLSAQHACPPYSMFPASLFDSRGQESDLYLRHSRHLARLHGERFEVNRPNAAQRFHYLQMAIDIETVLRVDIRTPSKEYTRNVGIYSHHDKSSQTLIEPAQIISLDPKVTTLLYRLKPEHVSAVADMAHPMPSILPSADKFHPRTNFLLSVGATASEQEWSDFHCPYFGLDLLVTPLHQLKEHIVPEPAKESGHVTTGHKAHTCVLLHNNAAELKLPLNNHMYHPIWWSGLQHVLEFEFSVTHQHGMTASIFLQHSFISSMFTMELVAIRQDENSPTVHPLTYTATAESMVSSEKVQRDTFHPVDLFFTRDYKLNIHALLPVGNYKVIIRERLSGALAQTIGVHEDELCVPVALVMGLKNYVPLSTESALSSGIHKWPITMAPFTVQEVIAQAGEAADEAEKEFKNMSDQQAIEAIKSITDPSESQVIPSTFDDENHHTAETDAAAGLVHPTPLPAHEPTPHPLHEEVEEPNLLHPLHEDDENEGKPKFDKHGMEGDSDEMMLGGKKHPDHADWSHPASDRTTLPDAYESKALQQHLTQHHPGDARIEQIDRVGHAENPSFIEALKATGRGEGFFGQNIKMRMHQYSTVDLSVFSLAVLVTVALFCVAFSLHCRCGGGGVYAICVRLLLLVCPCCARCFVHKKLKTGDEIQLKKTLYYSNYNMGDDDNL